jgi:NAD-dependent dihydropyrimidine dehydrogenase PreA subunit
LLLTIDPCHSYIYIKPKKEKMLREVVKIDETLCDGCGACIPACHEGALQIIDGKARLISDLMCDGLGACLGHCPQGAITVEKREAEPYNETKVMEIMAKKGKNTVLAHLQHLKEHNELEFLREGVHYLKENAHTLDFDIREVVNGVHQAEVEEEQLACGCPGSEARGFKPQAAKGAGPAIPATSPAAIPGFAATGSMAGVKANGGDLSMAEVPASEQSSELRQWPVQMHLINPVASYFRGADVVLAADCVAYALGDFHSGWLRGKNLAIACPKLDSGLEGYVTKIRSLIDDARINTLTVMMMQVPCCGGLMQMVKAAAAECIRKVPVKTVIVGVEGEILQEEWI